MTKTFKSLFVAVLVILACKLPTAASEHPVALQKDADCASCHEEKTKGKAVHSAIAMGCTTCHAVKTEGDTTTVNLTAPKEQLCFTCHDKAKEEQQHGPYEKGQCVSCHDPHTGDHPKQLRANGNELCTECHLERSELKEDTKEVSLFKTRTVAIEEWNDTPKIYLNRAHTAGHPWSNHPVSLVEDIRNPGEKISCLTCHEAHAAQNESLIRVPALAATDAKETKDAKAGGTATASAASEARPMGICASCHDEMDRRANLKVQEAAAGEDARRQKLIEERAGGHQDASGKKNKKDKKAEEKQQ